MARCRPAGRLVLRRCGVSLSGQTRTDLHRAQQTVVSIRGALPGRLSCGGALPGSARTCGEGKQYSRREYSYGSFTRSFQFPENVQGEAINARYEDGMLKITLPKVQEKPKASKQINIE